MLTPERIRELQNIDAEWCSLDTECQRDIQQAYKDKLPIQYCDKYDKNWGPSITPQWYDDFGYRIAPEYKPEQPEPSPSTVTIEVPLPDGVVMGKTHNLAGPRRAKTDEYYFRGEWVKCESVITGDKYYVLEPIPWSPTEWLETLPTGTTFSVHGVKFVVVGNGYAVVLDCTWRSWDCVSSDLDLSNLAPFRFHELTRYEIKDVNMGGV